MGDESLEVTVDGGEVACDGVEKVDGTSLKQKKGGKKRDPKTRRVKITEGSVDERVDCVKIDNVLPSNDTKKENSVPYLKFKFQEEIRYSLKKKLGFSNIMECPRLVKICLNRGFGSIGEDKKVIEKILEETSNICCQKAISRRAKKSISNFKLKEGSIIGCMVTLRGNNMYEFLYKLINIVIPRIRDFRGLSKRGFDSSGVYNFGIKEQISFPEVDIGDVWKIVGANVTFVTTSKDKEKNLALLEAFGLPFK